MIRLLWVISAWLMLSWPWPAFAQPTTATEPAVTVDGLPINSDCKPVLHNNRSLVPLRALAEAINVQLSWDKQTQTIRAADANNTITLQIGNRTAVRNGIPLSMDVPPQIVNGRTLVPLRFFSEAFSCRVAWQPSENLIQIFSPPQAMEVIGFYALGDRQTSSWTNLFGQPFPAAATGNTDIVSTLALGWYSLDRAGNLLTKSAGGWQQPADFRLVLDKAAAYKLRTQMVIHMTDADGSLTGLLTDRHAVEKAVASIVEEAGIYQGVNIDFEGLGWQDTSLTETRNNFTNFVTLLSQRLQAANRTLTLTLHAPNSVYRGYDYQKLGQLADEIIIMAHDYGSKPEPLDLVNQAVSLACQAVPPEKIILAVSVPSETAASLVSKVGIAKRHQLKGISLWRLGLLNQDMWFSLRTCIIPRQ
ncbi:stalk domain-containing protein [Desulforamulus hydrothermalis]|uniref:Copper amine oxidase domain protein n=1 Tax=Desulforamulus hydrothermalis Lam5 = DSM 18033 TaxID=1121428 RepID=K8E009_9FIRM|nr:stalk domain-containing protein [Desulforamulus hydrothermalis]CCO08789.1 Copper amine oxidase domain protein [Desulforamulus hydrothermalis Lam5 = DSM 18033]SHG71558.1 Glycosyl hydrolases family 18 [Desulforamulus hydrothermalis Lam5 = DSM 18033]